MSTNSEAPESAVPGWWRRENLSNRAISAFKTGLAAAFCIWLGNLFGLSHSYWSAVSAIVVMGSDTALTFASCRDRIISTAIGAFLGWVTSYVWHGHYLFYGLSVAICLFGCSMLEFEKLGRLAAVALSIIVLVRIDGGPAQAAIARFLEVALGIIVGLGVTLLAFPPHLRRWRQRPRSNYSPERDGMEEASHR